MRVVTVFWIYNITIIYTGCRCQNLNNSYFKKKKKQGKFADGIQNIFCFRTRKYFFSWRKFTDQ
jgi:hypothetical protein